MKTLLCTFLSILTLHAQAKDFDVDGLKQGLESKDKKIVSSALDTCTSMGKHVLPQLRQWAIDPDPRLKTNARTAIGRITGQWASQTNLIWHRDFKKAQAQAKKENKPLMVLHLFGKLDEEFC